MKHEARALYDIKVKQVKLCSHRIMKKKQKKKIMQHDISMKHKI